MSELRSTTGYVMTTPENNSGLFARLLLSRSSGGSGSHPIYI